MCCPARPGREEKAERFSCVSLFSWPLARKNLKVQGVYSGVVAFGEPFQGLRSCSQSLWVMFQENLLKCFLPLHLCYNFTNTQHHLLLPPWGDATMLPFCSAILLMFTPWDLELMPCFTQINLARGEPLFLGLIFRTSMLCQGQVPPWMVHSSGRCVGPPDKPGRLPLHPQLSSPPGSACSLPSSLTRACMHV